MGILDSAQDMFDRGVTAAKGAVSTVAGEQLEFVREFCRMCRDGYDLGYHERNGGNASYLLTDDDVRAIQPFFYATPSSWVSTGLSVPEMAGRFLLVTGSGRHLRNAIAKPVETIGVIEVNQAGDSWRIVWGLKGGGRPTSEIGAHLAAFAARAKATGGRTRVLYHAHPVDFVALTALLPADAKTLTRLLWSTLSESVIAFPGGLGFIGKMVPGSQDLAKETARALERFEACAWQLHGLFASGETFDDALGLVAAADKAAGVYLRARAAQGGAATIPTMLEDGDIRAAAFAYGLALNDEFLA